MMPASGNDRHPPVLTVRPRNRWRHRLALAAIVALAVVLRLAGIGWGDDHYYHPDELFLTMVTTGIGNPGSVSAYFDTATSPLNPYNSGFDSYVYGTAPLFAAKVLGALTSHDAFGNAHEPGRWLSVIYDTGSVLAVYWIGRRLFGRATALLAALLLAATVLNIQAAHYFTTDAAAAFFATATFACVLAAWHRRSFALFALAGLAAGLAAASKPNLLLTAGFLALPLLESLRLGGWGTVVPGWSRLFGRRDGVPVFPVLLASAFAALVAVWTFRFAQPYAFTGPSPWSFRLNPQWRADLAFWRSAQEGVIDLPPSIQWAERTPVAFVLDNLVRWGMGPALGIAALAGLLIVTWRIATARSWPSWWLLGIAGWVLFHIVFFGTGLAKVQRYLLPAYPLLVLLAAATLIGLVRWARAGGRLPLPGGWRLGFARWCHPGYILPVVTVVSTVLWAVAFTSVFTREHTRTAASEWIYANVPPSATIATEYWDFGLPVWLPDGDASQYPSLALDLYRTDSSEKLSVLIGQLQRTDYIVISSNRLFDSIPRMPWRYPMTTVYYDALFSGALGFDQVARFRSSPELLGVTIDDRDAEESLTVYDHPEVFIFRKSDRWSDDAAWHLLDDALGNGGLDLLPVQTQPDRMMLDTSEAARLRDSGTWRNQFDPASLANRWPVPVWYLALQLLSLPAIPLLWRTLTWLPDRGYALAKTFGVTAVAGIAWLLVSLDVLAFGPGAVIAAWLALMALAALAIRGQAPDLLRDLADRRRWVIAIETMLVVLLAGGAWLRSLLPAPLQPDGNAGALERMAVFNAVVRTPSFPPYDPWLAGGTIHDTYLGLVPWAALTRLTGIVPEVAFSLTLVTLFALVVINAWSAGATLLAALRPTDHHRLTPGLMAGALVAPLLLLIGPVTFAQRIGTGDWSGAGGGLPALLDGLRRALSGDADLPPGAWAMTSSAEGEPILPVPLADVLTGDITLALQAMPVVVGAVTAIGGFALATGTSNPWASPAAGQASGVAGTFGGWRRATPVVLVTGLSVAFLLGANWLLAIPVVILAAGLAFLAAGAARTWLVGWAAVRDVTLLVLGILLVAGLAILPFLAHYGAFGRRRVPVEESLGVAALFGHFGIPLAIVGAYLLAQLWRLATDAGRQGPVGMLLAAAATVLLAGGLAVAVRLDVLPLLLLLLMGVAGIAICYHQHDIRHLVVLAIVSLALALIFASERFRLERPVGDADIASGFGAMAWVLLALAAVPALAMLAGAALTRRRSGAPRALSLISLIAIAVLIVAGAAYPALAVPNRIADRDDQPPTLDAYTAMRGDAGAVDWMRANIHGLPVILEGSGVGTDSPPEGRISAMTGFPTVLGGAESQREQRPGMDRLIDTRLQAVDRIYGRPGDLALVEPLLREWNVELIYVGPYERSLYDETGLAKFGEAAASGDLVIVYEDGGVTIYRYVPRGDDP